MEKRKKWDFALRNLMLDLLKSTKKPVIVAGDLNVSHNPIDLFDA